MHILAVARFETAAQHRLGEIPRRAEIKLSRRHCRLAAEVDRKRMAIGRAHFVATNFEALLLRAVDQRAYLPLGHVVKARLHQIDHRLPGREAFAVDGQRIILGLMP